MKFEFEETQSIFISGSQKARVWTEQWAADWLYCPNCGSSKISQFPPNLPVADFFCPSCNDQFELKSQKKPFGAKVVDGAYFTKMERLASATNPNLVLLNYDLSTRSVRNVNIVPKHFFIREIIEKRKPLGPNARRAGWVGSNILLGKVPKSGMIEIVREGVPLPKADVLSSWQRTLFLRDQNPEARGWLVEVMKCVESIGKTDFDINDTYDFEQHLQLLYPDNSNVKPKIRQQLQLLRDKGYIEFLSHGRYRLRQEN